MLWVPTASARDVYGVWPTTMPSMVTCAPEGTLSSERAARGAVVVVTAMVRTGWTTRRARVGVGVAVLDGLGGCGERKNKQDEDQDR